MKNHSQASISGKTWIEIVCFWRVMDHFSNAMRTKSDGLRLEETDSTQKSVSAEVEDRPFFNWQKNRLDWRKVSVNLTPQNNKIFFLAEVRVL